MKAFVLDYPSSTDGSVYNWVKSMGWQSSGFKECDVLVIPGSVSDVDTKLYQEEKHPTTWNNEYSCKYDGEALKVIQQAISKGKKIVGICKGLQLLHVAMGGKLIQDIGYTKHCHVVTLLDAIQCGEGDYHTYHPVAPASHHQAVDPDTMTKAHGQLVGYDPDDDGVEAVYYPLAKAIGVQFHPEWASGDVATTINSFIKSYLE